MWLRRMVPVYALPAAIGLVIVILAASAALVLVSLRGANDALFGFRQSELVELKPDEDIAGRAAFDRPGYLPGSIIRYRIRVRWRRDAVTPDFEMFRNSVNVFPLDERESSEWRRSLANGIDEYTADFELQSVSAEFPASWRLDTAALYYTLTHERQAEVRTLHIESPLVQVGEYFPQNIAGIPLEAIKPQLNDARLLRKTTLLAFGGALCALAMLLLWQFGRRRPNSALSDAERLWRRFRVLQDSRADARSYLLGCESIFTRALELRCGIGPTVFWSGDNGGAGEWRDTMNEARVVFSNNYRAAEPEAESLARVASIIEEMLRPMVRADRMHREEGESALRRLRGQPGILWSAAGICTMAIVLLVLAVRPLTWLSADLQAYNRAVGQATEEENLDEALVQFRELADSASEPNVRFAALYNFGTLTVDRRLSMLSRDRHQNLLSAMFLSEVTLDLLLHELELDAEFEVLTVLQDITRRYAEAETALKYAVRLRAQDAAARRNLELMTKMRKAIARTLRQLVQQGEKASGPQQQRSQTTIDLQRLMQLELPEDFAKTAAGKDDRDYFIMERF